MYRPRSARTDTWSSRDSDAPGVGFPSCCTDLARVPRNVKDPSGYYRLLGLPPWADEAEVKRTCRKLLAQCHPDGEAPDLERFRRVEEIYRILSDPVRRVEYQRTPEGYRYVDSQVREELKGMAFRHGMSPDEVREAFTTDADLAVSGGDWDYFSKGYDEGDRERSRRWYPHLIRVGAAIGYRAPIRLFLTDTWGFEPRSGIVRVDRAAEPSHEGARRAMALVPG